MSEMWAVSNGCYSDYHVLCVCPTKADAKAILAKIKDDESEPGAFIESFPVADATSRSVAVLVLAQEVWDNGTTGDLRERTEMAWPWSYTPPVPITWRWVRPPVQRNKGGRLDMQGTDHERVRKTFSELRARLLAEDAFRMAKEHTR